VEDDVVKSKSIDIDLSSLPTKLSFEEMIRVLVKAGYEYERLIRVQEDDLLLLLI